MVVGTKRITQDGELEEYVAWITRATDVVKQMMVNLDVPDWVEEIHRRKFRWAGRTARLSDGRWTKEVMLWCATGSRKRGRPKSRWTDSLNKFFDQGRQSTNTFWMEIAQEEESWLSLEDNFFVDFALGRLEHF